MHLTPEDPTFTNSTFSLTVLAGFYMIRNKQ